MLTRYSTSLCCNRKLCKLLLKVLSKQRDQIILFNTKGTTFATELNNISISPILNFEIFEIEK